MAKSASAILYQYQSIIGFDYFIFPVEKSQCLSIAIVAPYQVTNLIDRLECNGNVKTIERRNHEEYARLRRIYSANKVLSEYRPYKIYDTSYKSLKDIPAFRATLARSFEIVAMETLKHQGFNVKHEGDKISAPDVVEYDNEGNAIAAFECKIGGGKFDCAYNEKGGKENNE